LKEKKLSLPRKSPEVKLIVSVMGTNEEVVREAVSMLEKQFGAQERSSHLMPFNFTTYYEKEMGPDLFRIFVVFRHLIKPERLPRIKLWSNELEQNLSMEGRRRVNLDPGYISAERLVLATGKNYTHRIYLGQGIYADLTLVYHNKSFNRLPWTYPDYGEEEVISFMNETRKDYMAQLRDRDIN